MQAPLRPFQPGSSNACRASHVSYTLEQLSDIMPVGRPTTYTEVLGMLICERLRNGATVMEVCADDGMPTQSSVYKWLSKHTEFAEGFSRARETLGHVQADRAVGEALSARDAQLGMLRFKALTWHAGKLLPKVYGEKSELAVTGADGGAVQYVVYGAKEVATTKAWIEGVVAKEPDSDAS